MGGQNTEINEKTVDVLIESAYFSPTNIRRTSKALGLRSESSPIASNAALTSASATGPASVRRN